MSPKVGKRTKENRKWDDGGSKKDMVGLDYSKSPASREGGGEVEEEEEEEIVRDVSRMYQFKML